MKKLLLLAFIAICIGLVIPHKLYAVDITVGASTWYAWWDSVQKEQTLKIDPAFLYGPALAVKFNEDYYLTFIYLYGKFDMPDEMDGGTLKRTDADLALNYRLSNLFKVFGGIKYNKYSSPGMEYSGIGPGFGLSVSYPLTTDLFLLGNISGFYLWASEDNDHDGKFDAKQYGFNSTLSIAYYIAPASTTITLGGRYQYFKVDYDSYKENGDHKHKFYGVTLTATYTFNI